MKLKSVYVINGVKVISGVGKGTRSAQPGDEFEIDEETGKQFVKDGIAVTIDKSLPTEPKSGPEITTGDALDISGVAEPEADKPVKGKGGKSGKGKKAATEESTDDLGLGDEDEISDVE